MSNVNELLCPLVVALLLETVAHTGKSTWPCHPPARSCDAVVTKALRELYLWPTGSLGLSDMWFG